MNRNKLTLNKLLTFFITLAFFGGCIQAQKKNEQNNDWKTEVSNTFDIPIDSINRLYIKEKMTSIYYEKDTLYIVNNLGRYATKFRHITQQSFLLPCNGILSLNECDVIKENYYFILNDTLLLLPTYGGSINLAVDLLLIDLNTGLLIDYMHTGAPYFFLDENKNVILVSDLMMMGNDFTLFLFEIERDLVKNIDKTTYTFSEDDFIDKLGTDEQKVKFIINEFCLFSKKHTKMLPAK